MDSKIKQYITTEDVLETGGGVGAGALETEREFIKDNSVPNRQLNEKKFCLIGSDPTKEEDVKQEKLFQA
jgi:hypothetical protein